MGGGGGVGEREEGGGPRRRPAGEGEEAAREGNGLLRLFPGGLVFCRFRTFVYRRTYPNGALGLISADGYAPAASGDTVCFRICLRVGAVVLVKPSGLVMGSSSQENHGQEMGDRRGLRLTVDQL